MSVLISSLLLVLALLLLLLPAIATGGRCPGAPVGRNPSAVPPIISLAFVGGGGARARLHTLQRPLHRRARGLTNAQTVDIETTIGEQGKRIDQCRACLARELGGHREQVRFVGRPLERRGNQELAGHLDQRRAPEQSQARQRRRRLGAVRVAALTRDLGGWLDRQGGSAVQHKHGEVGAKGQVTARA